MTKYARVLVHSSNDSLLATLVDIKVERNILNYTPKICSELCYSKSTFVVQTTAESHGATEYRTTAQTVQASFEINAKKKYYIISVMYHQ